MNENQKTTFLTAMCGDWESIGSTEPKYRLTINAHWFTLKKIEDGKGVEIERFEYLGAFDMGAQYVFKGGKSTYGILSLSSEELELGKNIGTSGILEFKPFELFQRQS